MAILAGLLLLAGSVDASPPGPQSPLEHEARAREWMTRNGLDPAAIQDHDSLLAQGFARATFGIFEIYVPVEALADPQVCGDVGRAIHALVDVGAGWVRWLPDPGGTRGDLDKRLAPLGKWLDAWKPSLFGDAAALRGQDLRRALELDPKLASAWDAVDSALERCDPLDNEGGFERTGIVLCPRRVDFIDVLSVVGLCDSSQREFTWVEKIAHWTAFDLPRLRFIALQHPATTVRDNPNAGIRLDSKNPKALEEHVAQLGARSLLDRVYADLLDSALAAGLANELVIELYGEVDTRTDGDLRARATQERSVFVPGAASDGFLPPDSAETRWRAGHGADHFVSVLAQSQEQGKGSAREPWEKKTGFQLQSDDGAETVVIHAPFLGSEGSLPPSAKFRGDHAEFIRAYTIAFLHWLRNEENNARKTAQQQFGSVLKSLALAGNAAELPELIVQVYEMPLSAENGEELYRFPTLEGRFLEWLAKK